MKFRGLIVAVVVLLALGGLLHWSNHRKPSPPAAAASSPASPTILKFNSATVTGLSLAPKGSKPVALAKDKSGQWQITAPQAYSADQDAVSDLLSSLSNLSADRVVENQATDLKPYGLDDPSLSLDMTMNDHNARKLLLGDDTPAGSDVYAMLAGDPRVFTLAGYSKTSLEKGLNDLRDKRLITLQPDKVSRVSLEKNGHTIEFARTKDGWQILKPTPMRADAFAVDDLVRSVTGARMDLSANSGAAAAFAHAAPVDAVALTGDQGTQTLELRKNKDDDYARSSIVSGTYKVDSSLGTALDKNLDDFRDKKLFDFGFEEPGKIELHNGARAWFLTRSGSDWWSNGKKMENVSVESLVDALRDLAATGFPTSGFSQAEIEATVTSSDGRQTEKVLISKSGNNYIAKRENDPSLYQLDADSVTNLIDAANSIRPAAPPAK
jgi:hypothetical protein